MRSARTIAVRSGDARTYFEAKVLRSVRVADAAHDAADKLLVVGNEALFNVCAEQVAEHAAEIFVARERHPRARIRDHADEAGEQPGVRQRVELPLDGFLLVEEPPA